MNDYWHSHQIAPFGAFADSEIAELAAIHRQYLAEDQDPEAWGEADWDEFERDRLEFERSHHVPISQGGLPTL